MNETRPARGGSGVRDEVADWMASRWAEIAWRDGEAPAVTVGDRAEPDFSAPEPMDLGLRFSEAKPGDSISKLLGSSDPRAIGKFMKLNGMRGQDSTLRAGRSYVVPLRWDDATKAEIALGSGTLRVDNARLRAIEDEHALQARQAALFADGRNIWTGVRVEPPYAPSSTRQRSQQSWLDNNAAAKAVGGSLAFGVGLPAGVVRGGVHSAEGLAGAGLMTYRMMSPFDVMLSRPGKSMRDRVFLGGLSAVDAARRYAGRAVEDPSIIRDDIASAAAAFNRKHNPFATPVADTFEGELRRTFGVGMNDGEGLFDVASVVGGVGLARGPLGLLAAAPAAGEKELAYRAARPLFEAYLAEGYKGMGHHIKRRATRLPRLLGGGPLPPWVMEAPFNKIAQDGLTRRDFLRTHVGVDRSYRGGRAAARSGQRGWRAKDLGWDEFGPLDRLEYGTAPATKMLLLESGAGALFDDASGSDRVP